MFEFRDKKLGPLKFISVSEARARFADCLKEGDCNIVVTRHGVPYKVFVSYEDYLTLKNSAQVANEENKVSLGKTLEAAQTAPQETATSDSPLSGQWSPVAGSVSSTPNKTNS